MVNPMVERATSDMLVGPDWSMNIGICDSCNRDPGQAKDVVKGIKKRLGSKNVKAQLLALTLLETIVKNCGDLVHKHVAERDLLRDMVKMVKKKPDYHVKEKILILIDTWQEAFGGARARYPQYHAAYNELLHLGMLFPKRTERSPPVFTPLQTQPLMRNPQNGNDAVESSADAEASNLSMTEIHNARGIIDVLAEMLIAVDPAVKEGLRQEVVVDLVLQCRTYKKRVVHLVNSTSDESLLCEGLALNDELQRVLDKHEALISGASTPEKLRVVAKNETLVSGVSVPSEKLKPKTNQLALVPVDAPLIDTRDKRNPGSTVGARDGEETQFLSPTTTSGPSTTSVMVNPKFDLLSGDDYSTPTAENYLAIVPLAEPQPAPPLSQQNLISQNSKSQNLTQEQTNPSSPQCQHVSSKQNSFNLNGNLPHTISQNTQGSIPVAGQTYSTSPKFKESQQFPSQQPSFQPNGNIHNKITTQYEPVSLYTQVSNPATRQRFSSLPQLEQSQHFQSHQPSFGPNGSVSVILSPQYEPRSPFAQGSSPTAEQTYSSSPHFQHCLTQPSSFNPNGSFTSMVSLQSEPTSPYSQESNPAWDGHTTPQQQQQPSSPVYGTQTRHGGLPPPPWETQPEDSNQLGGMHYPTLGNDNNQPMGMYMQQQITGGGLPPMSHQAIHPQQHITGGSVPSMSHQIIHPQQHITGGSPPPMSHQSIPPQQHITGGSPPPMTHQSICPQQHMKGGSPPPMSHQVIRPQLHITGGSPPPMNHQAIRPQQHITGGSPPPMNHQAIRPQLHITGNPLSPMIHKAAAIHPTQQQIISGPPSPMSHKAAAIHPAQHQITGGPPSPMIHHQAIHLEQFPQQQFQGQHTMSVIPHYHMAYMYPQHMYGDPMAQAYGYGGGYRYGYGYTQPQFLDHRMSWLSVRDDGFLNNTVYATPSTSNASNVHMPSLNPSNPEEKLFQDLFDSTSKTTTGKK